MKKQINQEKGLFNGWGNFIFLLLVLSFIAAFFCGLLIPVFITPILDVSMLNLAFKVGLGGLITITLGVSFIKFHLHSFFKFMFKWLYLIIFRKEIPKKNLKNIKEKNEKMYK